MGLAKDSDRFVAVGCITGYKGGGFHEGVSSQGVSKFQVIDGVVEREILVVESGNRHSSL